MEPIVDRFCVSESIHFTRREMGRRGRAPCCEKIGLKRGPWTPAEDLRLITYIHKNGRGTWRSLPKQAGLLRCGKSCRLRWINYLRPEIKRGNFTPEEEETILKLHESLGNKWSIISTHLPGRTDNEIKNVWNTRLKKRLVSKGLNICIDEPNSCESNCKQAEVLGHEEQAHLISESGSPSKEKEPNIIGIPTEPDLDYFWDLLDDEYCSNFHETPNIIETPDLDFWDLLDDEYSSNFPKTHDTKTKPCTNESPSSSTPSDLSRYNEDYGKGQENQLVDPQEVNAMENKQDHLEEIHDITLEPVMDFWDMLDTDFSSSVSPMEENETVQNEEQSHSLFESGGIIPMENKPKPLDDIFEIPVELPNLYFWDLLHEESCNFPDTDHDSKTKSSINESKESPCGSYVSCYNEDYGKGQEDQADLLLKLEGPQEVKAMLYKESNHDYSQEIHDIPLDFWDMVNDDLRFSASSVRSTKELMAHQIEASGEESQAKIESKKWLTYLENELELS
ncbi:uncharacterized protein LOC143846097 [Tasmannia lanceolata]|uniref:uncharacterized protein LOC143846097 n=1 Tax=Tasmannia lanceolata TaxID=3420 RepID=UPI0040649302